MPIANLALAGLAALALSALLARLPARRRLAGLGLAAAFVAADLLVLPLRGAVADPGNSAYLRLGREEPGRILELPVLPRGLGHFGSVYLYYATQEARERPTGYSTLAPEATYDFTDRFRRLNCGAWAAGDAAELERLGIRYLVFHLSVFSQAALPGAWFAWNGLQNAGYRQVEGGPAVWLFSRDGGAATPPPVPEPDRSKLVLCDGWRGDAIAFSRARLWLYGSGRVTIALEASEPATVVAAVDGFSGVSFQLPEQALTLGVGALGWHLVELTSDAQGLELSSARSPAQAARRH